MLRLGEVTLTITQAYIGLVWVVAGLLCTLLTDRRGVWVAAAAAFLAEVMPAVVILNVTSPVVEFFRYGGEIDRYFDESIVPLFGAVIGALIGELIMPSEYEE